jgi:hypothetical protein
LDADELVREYRTRFETEPPAAPLAPNEAEWKNRLRLAQRVPAVLVAIVGVVIGGSVLLERAQVLHEGSEGPDAPGAVEVDIPVGTAQPDDSDSTAEVAFATSAVTDIRAPSLRLEIWTTGLCWISAMADGERAVYRLMHPGERALVEARTGIVLRVGDAGAFRYSINGAAGRPLGRSGEPVTIRMTNDNLESLYAEPANGFPAEDAHGSTEHRRDLEPRPRRRVSSSEMQARRFALSVHADLSPPRGRQAM